MTDDELTEATVNAFIDAGGRWLPLVGMEAALAIATPEIERRQLERMREWANDLPIEDAEADKIFTDYLDAFAKENER